MNSIVDEEDDTHRHELETHQRLEILALGILHNRNPSALLITSIYRK